MGRWLFAPAAAIAVACCADPGRAGDPAYGEYLAGECTTCHQRSGQSKGIPSITGWPAEQFIAVLKSYKHKDRPNEVMQSIAGRLGDTEMESLAAYFGSLGQPKKK